MRMNVSLSRIISHCANRNLPALHWSLYHLKKTLHVWKEPNPPGVVGISVTFQTASKTTSSFAVSPSPLLSLLPTLFPNPPFKKSAQGSCACAVS